MNNPDGYQIEALRIFGVRLGRLEQASSSDLASRSRWSRARRLTRSPIRTVTASIALVVLLLAGAYAVPPVRAALNDVASNFASYLSGDQSTSSIGRELTHSEVRGMPYQRFMESEGATDQRLIASAGGYDLLMWRTDDAIEISLDGGVIAGMSAEEWAKQFAGSSIYVAGPLPAQENRAQTPLFGMTAREVQKVRVVYADGGTVSANSSTGGFVALVDPNRDPVEINGMDENGEVVDTVDLAYITWGQF